MPQLAPLGLTNELGGIKIGGTYSLGDTLGATFDETINTNPFTSLLRYSEIDEARHGALDYTMGEFGEIHRSEPATPELSDEEQNLRIEQAGLQGRLTAVEGETVEGLNIRIKYKKEEIERQAVLQNAPDGIGTAAAQFGVGLVASFFDPLNVASGFVPIVGPARYAAMLSKQGTRMGRAGVRARVGAAEGFVGAAMVEPVVLAGVNATQADYTIYDTFANLAFGTVLGAGLHSVGGVIKDTVVARRLQKSIDAVSLETRAAAIRAAIGQVADGRIPVGIDQILRMDLEASTALSGGTVAGPGGPRPIITGMDEVLPTTTHVVATMGDAADGTMPTQRSFRTEAEATAAAEKLGKQTGIAAVVRKVGEDDYRLDIEVPVDKFVRKEDGDFMTFPNKRTAEKTAREMEKQLPEGSTDTFHAVKMRDEFILMRNPNSVEFDAIRASAAEMVLPVELPSRQPGADAQSGINVQSLIDDVQRSNDSTNRIFDAQERAGVDEATKEIEGLPELETTEQVQAHLDELTEELDRTLELTGEGRPEAPLKSSKVVDENGVPITVFHHGAFDPTEGGAFDASNGVHFGTRQAARERDAVEQGENLDLDADDLGVTTEAHLNIENPKRVVDQGANWADAIAKAKAEGHDGIVYINKFEDKGSTSYIAFESDQIITDIDAIPVEATGDRAVVNEAFAAHDAEIKKAQELKDGLKDAAFCVIRAA